MIDLTRVLKISQNRIFSIKTTSDLSVSCKGSQYDLAFSVKASYWAIVMYSLVEKKTVSWAKADKMSRKQQFSITASSLTFHNPPRVGEIFFILFNTSSHPFALKSLSVLVFDTTEAQNTALAASHRQQREQTWSTEVQTGESNEQVLKQTDESRDGSGLEGGRRHGTDL